RTMNWESAVYSILDIVEPGESYDISIWARLSGTAASASQLTVNTTCAGEAAGFTQIASRGLVDTEGRQLSGTYIVPDDCTLEALNVYVDNVAVGASYFIDDLSVTLRPPPVSLPANPDFGVDASGWFGFGRAAIATTADQFHEGAQSGYSTGRTATWQGPATSLLGILTPGES